MTNFAAGRQAEAAAATHLKRIGYTIIEQNWRTKWCEIDLVVKKRGVVYFCEVKYRVNDQQGGGMDYITAQKLRQMRFAAEFWVHSNRWSGEYQLLAVEVFGPEFDVTAVLEDL